jgi:hypothetical protein
MATFFTVDPPTARRSFLNQLIDVLQADVSSSISRRTYQVFVTGGVGPGVTSSLFHTVYDNDWTLQTANPVFDVTVGIAPPDVLTTGIASKASTGYDTYGKYFYPSSSLMMREKTDIYGQFAQILLGNRKSTFSLPTNANAILANDNYSNIDSALFIAFKRLFARDQIKRETFAMRFYQTASYVSSIGSVQTEPPASDSDGRPNINVTTTTGSMIYTDVGSGDAQRFFSPGGQYGYLVNAAATNNAVGLLYYDAGVAVFDIEKITSGSQFMSGTIRGMTPTGLTVLGGAGTETANKAKLVPDFMVSGSVDDLVDHFCSARFGSSTLSAMTFQNVTNINSELIFCRVGADEANYSSNPSYLDADGKLSISDSRIQDPDLQDTFSYVTTVGLYDDKNTLVAVAKLSRPVEKNPSRDLTFRVRLDF